jgi:GT2 family glycosyltransferase
MKVLVGISTRNRAELLAKAIRSALDQDYPNIEVAVFDDASTDETPQLQALYPQVRWMRTEKPQGYLPLRNYLMKETDAAFYFSLDDDAWFIKGDELSRGIELLRERSEVAALAYDILSPDRPTPDPRATPYKTHTFIGCGHLLRLSAVREVGFYTPYPGFYGGEEQDLCVQLFDSGYEVMFMPGVHVWHDKTMLARDHPAQHRSSVCNDLAFTLRRCPFPTVLWMLPGKVISHLSFSIKHKFLRSYSAGVKFFLTTLPATLSSRQPVSYSAYQRVRARSQS